VTPRPCRLRDPDRAGSGSASDACAPSGADAEDGRRKAHPPRIERRRRLSIGGRRQPSHGPFGPNSPRAGLISDDVTLAVLLALDADPLVVVAFPRAQGCRNEGHAADRTDRRLVVVHVPSVADRGYGTTRLHGRGAIRLHRFISA